MADGPGQPTVMTEEVLKVLKEAFLMGCTDREACLYAGISNQTLYNYQEANPEYVEQKEQWKDYLKIRARKTVAGKIDGDPETAKWYLERKAKDEFSSRTENTGKDGKPLIIKVTKYARPDKTNPV